MLPFPAVAPRPKPKRKPISPDAPLVSALAKLHHTEGSKADDVSFEPGELMLAYPRGVFRYLGQLDPLAIFEPVLTPQLKRKSGPPDRCDSSFCRKLPAPVLAKLKRFAQIELS